MNLGLAELFLAYTFVFVWSFNRIVSLPLSAQPLRRLQYRFTN